MVINKRALARAITWEMFSTTLADAEGVVRLLRIGLERLNYSRQVWADTEAQIADVLRREG